jgi:ABC-type branched-subunit amino acid transport system substrate-binding protein
MRDRRFLPSRPPRLAFMLLLGLATCAGKTVIVDGEEVSEDEAARRALEKAEREAEAGRAETAEARYRDVLELFPESDAAPAALNGLAILKLDQSGCDAARLYDERLIDEFPNSPQAESARSRRDACAPDEGPEAGPKSTLRQAFEAAQTDAEKKDVASRAADAALEAGDPLAAIRWLYEVRRLEEGPAQRDALDDEIRRLAREQLSARGIRALVEELSPDAFLYEELSFRLGLIQLHVGDAANARSTLETYLDAYPNGAFAARAQARLDELAARENVQPGRLGVLLPLSGRHRSYGELALQAIRLALPEGESPVELVVRDTKSDAVESAEQAGALILEEGVVGILGPIFTYEARPAALEAQRLGVPLLTVSAAEDIARLGPFVFRNGVTNQVQMKALVAYVMDVLEMERFAILYPRHPYGEELLHLFWDEVEARRGEIRGVESYSLQETTFSPQVKSLVARDDIDRRTDYREALRECDEQPDSYRKARCKENVRKNLAPIIDFDGLFIPDYPRSLSMITAALAFEDVIVEQDPRRLRTIERTLGRKVKPVTLLGASGWNSEKLIERADRNVENAIFTDGFFAGSDDPTTVEFVRRYRDAYERTPRLYPEALFYDSARIIRQVVEERRPVTRDAFREGLRGVHDFDGVTGRTSFRNGTDAEKTVHILTIRDGQIAELEADQPPPGREKEAGERAAPDPESAP